MGRSAWDKEAKKVVWADDDIKGLPPGLAGGRYRCRACREWLILKGTKTDSKVQPHFAHRGGEGCSRPEEEALLDAADEVVIRLREQIRALAGIAHCTTTSPGEDPTDPSGMPPAVIAQCGTTTVVFEAPTQALPGTEAIRRRIRAVRDEHAGAQHVWFLKRDLSQFNQLDPHPVWLRGKDVVHEQVAPNEQQEAILAAGGHVYWLDGKAVLVPYGIRRFRHPVQSGQDWTNWPRWRSDPREDWRISKPRPAPDADTWGLVPIAFASLTRTRGTFRPADAHHVMDELYTVQESRFNWRNQRAREVYAAVHAPPPAVSEAEPAPPAPAPAEAARAADPAPETASSVSQEAEPDPVDSGQTTSGEHESGGPASTVIPPRPVNPPFVPPAPAPAAPAAQRSLVRRWQRLLRIPRRGGS
ncbi:hypothetical protein ACF1A9_27770 [Streptomyces sp. NPDC014872]|uniref:hypothetical protein n=1 Tax=Streptomyces sp. NPDC014872 TaxID=3364926 RepID=UPI0036F6CA37